MKANKSFLILFIGILFLNKGLWAQGPIDKNQSFNMEQQDIVAISAFTANGNRIGLQKALNDGLDAGLTINGIKEVIVQLYAYAGFPRSLNALQTFMDVLKERAQKGIKDEIGREPSLLPTNKSRLDFGTEMQTKLVGQPTKGPIFEFAPAIDSFLKEHLFGDIFGRDNIDWKTRELATISALAAIGGVENQLQSHFGVGMHNGLTEVQLDELVAIIQTKVGTKEGNAAKQILNTVLKRSDTKTENPDSAKGTAVDAIFPKGEKAPRDHFTGTAWVKMLAPKDETGTYTIGNVFFEKGARTNWHLHPGGQTLIVLDGQGWYQEKGKPARQVKTGDVVVIPSNIEHWHGAEKDNSFTHIAITNSKDGGVKWLQPVTDKEYGSLDKQ